MPYFDYLFIQMNSCLCFNIYGVSFKVRCKEAIQKDIKRLLFPFSAECKKTITPYTFDFESIYSPAEIASILNPALAEKGIWGFHGAGVIHKGSALIFLGQSGAGKSTLTRIFLKAGFKIIGDDIILMKETKKGIYVLPLFFGIQGAERRLIRIIPYSSFSFGRLSNIFVLSGIGNRTAIKGPISNITLKREIYKNILWALDKDVVKNQLTFVEKLVLTPGYYITLGHEILEQANLLIDSIEQVSD